MTERFAYKTGTISVANGAESVTGTGTAWSGRDRAGSVIYAYPADAAPVIVGIVAEVDPRGIYENLELPLVTAYDGDALEDVPYVMVDGPAIANGTTQAAILTRFTTMFEQSMGMVGNTADDVDMSLVPNNTLFVDDEEGLQQWRDGVLEPVPTGITQVAIQKFIASGTYTPTAGMAYAIIEGVGGGGAGGGARSNTDQQASGAGGGAGGYSRKRVTAADIGASKPVTIGAGGTGVANDDGGAGSATSVGTLCVANGGAGGGNSQNGVVHGIGGASGAVGTGDVTFIGESGASGNLFPNNVNPLFSGKGGNSLLGFGAQPQVFGGTGGNNGLAGADNSGGGGSGACSSDQATNRTGGTGGSGIVIITEYCA